MLVTSSQWLFYPQCFCCSQTNFKIQTSKDPEKESFRKHRGKWRKCLLPAFSPFPTKFSIIRKPNFNSNVYFVILNAFNLDESNILLFGKALNFRLMIIFISSETYKHLERTPWSTNWPTMTIYTRKKKKRRVTYKDSFKWYHVILHCILKTIFIGYPAFHFRPSNSAQDINLTIFHYFRPINEISMLHILCTRRFFFVSVYITTRSSDCN